MKLELTTQGRVELTPTETAIAVLDYVKNRKDSTISKAVEAWLLNNKDLMATRIRYSEVADGIQVVADVKQKVSDGGAVTKFSDDPKAKRNNKGGFKHQNKGIFKYMKDYFTGERLKVQQAAPSGEKRKAVDLAYENVWKFFKEMYPQLSEKHFQQYLYDKRVFGNSVKLNKKEGLIRVQ